jgi:hypothetical protein
MALVPDEFWVLHRSVLVGGSGPPGDREGASYDCGRKAIASVTSSGRLHCRPVGGAGYRVDVAKNGPSGMKGGV